MTTHLPLITSSRAKDFRACPRLHHLRYELGYRPAIESSARRFGTLFHLGLESWWKAQPSERLDAAIAALAGEADPFDRAKAEALLIGYDARWGDADLEVLAVEREFQTALVNPTTGADSRTFRLAGKLDAVVRDVRSDRVLVVEHKTSSEDITAGSEYWRRLRLDAQVSTYLAGAKAVGFDAAGCLYDVIGKPGLRPSAIPLLDENGVKVVRDAAGERVRTKDGKKWRQTGDAELGYVVATRPETPAEYRDRLLAAIADAPEKYFSRGEVVRLESEVADAAWDLWSTARSIREGEFAKRHPRNPDACVRWGSTCAFFDACCGIASLDDPLQFRRIDNPHEELAGDAAA